MAKKNSTKTATKEALQASEPKILAFKGWTGINIAESPIGWSPDYSEDLSDHAQSDLKNTFFVVQNNLETTNQLAVETRRQDKIIAWRPLDDGSDRPHGYEASFKGASCVYHNWLICGFDDGKLRYRNLSDDISTGWTEITHGWTPQDNKNFSWTEIMPYDGSMICLNSDHKIFKFAPTSTQKTIDDALRAGQVILKKAVYVEKPEDPPTVKVLGDLRYWDSWKDYAEDDVYGYVDSDSTDFIRPDIERSPSTVRISYTYTNDFGSTTQSPDDEHVYLYSPSVWNGGRCVEISGTAPENVTGVDIYFAVDDSMTKTIAGHVSVNKNRTWSFTFTGAMMDVSSWSMSAINVPDANTTEGPNATYCTHINGRIYFWNDKTYPERVYIGGDPGHEFSIARGVGGAFIDIKPGNGNIVNGVVRYKTSSGNNIVTVLCGNRNTSSVRRYNIIETNITMTNELQAKAYEFEEVSNVIGCNSRYGYAVFEDGLYSISRWGLGVTTMAMEYNNQMRTSYVSEPIDPVFKDKLSVSTQNAHMCCMDGKIFIALGDKQRTDDVLDPVIFVYDIKSKAWWTETIEDPRAPITQRPASEILHIFPLDSDEYEEGVGYICKDRVGFIPLTGELKPEKPKGYKCLLMTPELTTKTPVSSTHYLCQLDFRFDYLYTEKDIPLTIYIEGVDYYGRHFKVEKKVDTNGVLKTQYPVWIRVDKLVETFRIVLVGYVRFRLTHIVEKLYQQSSKVNLVYGFNDHIWYQDAHGDMGLDHHYLDSYNNYREVIVT